MYNIIFIVITTIINAIIITSAAAATTTNTITIVIDTIATATTNCVMGLVHNNLLAHEYGGDAAALVFSVSKLLVVAALVAGAASTIFHDGSWQIGNYDVIQSSSSRK